MFSFECFIYLSLSYSVGKYKIKGFDLLHRQSLLLCRCGSRQYDINGLRTQKGSTTYYYDTDNNLIAMVKGNDTLHFYYDSSNSPIAFTRNNTMYYYVKNIQGDIIKIVNEDGSLAYTYDYDAWRALLSIKDNLCDCLC